MEGEVYDCFGWTVLIRIIVGQEGETWWLVLALQLLVDDQPCLGMVVVSPANSGGYAEATIAPRCASAYT